MANEILRASDGKNYVACVPDQSFSEERLAKPSQLPKFGDVSNSAKANLPEFSLTGLSEAENALLQFGGSNSRKLQVLADFVEDDGGKTGEVTLEDLNEALSRDRSGMQRLSPEDKRAIQWMKNTMSSIADESGSFFQGLDLAYDDGISSRELTAYAAKRGATLKSAQAAREEMEKSVTSQIKENSQNSPGKDRKQEAEARKGTAGKEAKAGPGNQALDDSARDPEDNRVYGYSSLSDLPGVGEGNGKPDRVETQGKIGAEATEVVTDFGDPNVKTEDNGVVDYTVKRGDSISGIASDLLRRSLGRAVSQAELRSYVSKVVEMNGLAEGGRKADLIFPGEVLKFPPLCEVPSNE